MRAAVMLALASCVIRNDITHVTLRDPTQVAVADVLPIGSARGDIPATVPPYLDSPETGSWIERDGSGAIVAWCPHCNIVRRRVIVDKPALDLDGSASERLRFDADSLHMRWTFDEVHYGHRFSYRVPRIALDLVTPRANVASIDYESRVQRHDDDGPFEIGGMVWMGLWSAGGAGVIALGAHDHEPGVEIVGGVMIAIGAAVFELLLREYIARDEHHAITP